MIQLHYNLHMKMADVIHANHHNLLVLNRFNIPLGFGDKTLAEVCNKYGVNSSLFIFLCTVFSDHNAEPSAEQIANWPVIEIVNFLKNSHQYYTNTHLPKIQETLLSLSASCEPQHGKALERFFAEYLDEIKKHFIFEDKVVFPYIEQLANHKEHKAFKIKEFEDNHEDVEEKLVDLKNIIIKYIPASNNDDLRRKLLDELYHFEEDLNRHLMIENKFLIPMVSNLEKSVQ